jgi:hypothetical protein
MSNSTRTISVSSSFHTPLFLISNHASNTFVVSEHRRQVLKNVWVQLKVSRACARTSCSCWSSSPEPSSPLSLPCPCASPGPARMPQQRWFQNYSHLYMFRLSCLAACCRFACKRTVLFLFPRSTCSHRPASAESNFQLAA